MVTKSSHSISICPPHSPTRITKKSILKLPGAFHWRKTSRIRFWAFSYSIGEPCGRSNQLITYFMVVLSEPVKSPKRLLLEPADYYRPVPLVGEGQPTGFFKGSACRRRPLDGIGSGQ